MTMIDGREEGASEGVRAVQRGSAAVAEKEIGKAIVAVVIVVVEVLINKCTPIHKEVSLNSKPNESRSPIINSAETMSNSILAKPLANKIAIVTGASRGAGRGIALALGDAGATVFVTGRTGRGLRGKDGALGTIDDTADEVTKRGGRGIAVSCDHTDENQVRQLFDQINSFHERQQQQQLDEQTNNRQPWHILVNSVWGGNELKDLTETRGFWTFDCGKQWQGMFESGVKCYAMTTQYAVRSLVQYIEANEVNDTTRDSEYTGGLIVNVSFWDHGKYTGQFYYDLAKNTMNRMAYTWGLELAHYNIAAVSLSPGWMRTERVLKEFGLKQQDWAQDHVGEWKKIEALKQTESPLYIGRAVAALASVDQHNVLQRYTGKSLTVGDLARELNFTDIDGRQPEPFSLPNSFPHLL